MATLGPFRVGDQPADGLDLVIERYGDANPLSGFTSATVRMRRPDGTTQTWTGTLVQPNIVRSAWPTNPFTQVGLYRVRAELAGSGGILERASWVRFWART
jgi:hypothetical protein